MLSEHCSKARELLPFGQLLDHKSIYFGKFRDFDHGAHRTGEPGGIARTLIMGGGPRAGPSRSPAFPMPCIHITDLEAAINFWREKKPSADGVTLAPELRALAEVYALMVVRHEELVDERGMSAAALAAWLAWYDTTADTPCIAICSTSQGDELCKGCGRSFDEVQHWPSMTPVEKRATWRRITHEGSAWRFGRYADRALENGRR